MRRAYIIAATPRSGSFLLCEALHRTGMAGYPQEYASRDDASTWCEYHRYKAHIAYFHTYISRGTSANGIFGAKLMWPQVMALCDDIRFYLNVRDRSASRALDSFLGEVSYVQLLRRDRLRQAISLVRAMRSGVWSQKTGIPSPESWAQYDRTAIDWAIHKIDEENALWERHIAESGRPSLTIVYEDFSTNYGSAAERLIAWLQAGELKVVPVCPALCKQSDGVTSTWVERYLNEPPPSGA
jgi:LPS sulfotransferase NodH